MDYYDILEYTMDPEWDGFLDDSIHDEEWEETRMDVQEWTGEDFY